MKINRIGETSPGILLRHAEYGSVVRRDMPDVEYLVISLMDGTGERALVTLKGGTLKRLDQNTRVVPLDAVLHVFGREPDEGLV